MEQSEALTQNAARCIACARQMRREIVARLDYGDTNKIAMALETVARGGWWPTPDAFMRFLGTCDAKGLCWFLLDGCAMEHLSKALAICTGRDRLAWLKLISHNATGNRCPLLHDVAS